MLTVGTFTFIFLQYIRFQNKSYLRKPGRCLHKSILLTAG